MFFYTADVHFGHDAIIDLCNRPFENAAEMESIMIELWNAKVKSNDTVFIVGDLFYRHKDPESVLAQLKGKKRLILGNHDSSWTSKCNLAKYFQSVDSYLEISDGKRNVVLCHYPLMTWKHPQKTYMVHGHIHNRTDTEYWNLIKNNPYILNAGVDVNGLCPVTFEQMVVNNELYKEGLRFGDIIVGAN
jgi:calcineurin-like phosphoesterase family protein